MTDEREQPTADFIMVGDFLATYKSGCRDFRGLHLFGANLANKMLPEVDLSGACLAEANLPGSNLAGTNQSGADLTDAKL